MLIEGKYAKKIDVEWPEDHTFISKRSKDDLNKLFVGVMWTLVPKEKVILQAG